MSTILVVFINESIIYKTSSILLNQKLKLPEFHRLGGVRNGRVSNELYWWAQVPHCNLQLWSAVNIVTGTVNWRPARLIHKAYCVVNCYHETHSTEKSREFKRDGIQLLQNRCLTNVLEPTERYLYLIIIAHIPNL